MNELSHHLIRFLLLLLPQIIPQAICTRYGLSVGAKAAPVVRVLLILFFPVAYPISKVRTAAEPEPICSSCLKEAVRDWSLVLGGLSA
jgi:CBS domain containing-hemolysin-like protein